MKKVVEGESVYESSKHVIEVPDGVEFAVKVESEDDGYCTPGVGPAKITVKLGQ